MWLLNQQWVNSTWLCRAIAGLTTFSKWLILLFIDKTVINCIIDIQPASSNVWIFNLQSIWVSKNLNNNNLESLDWNSKQLISFVHSIFFSCNLENNLTTNQPTTLGPLYLYVSRKNNCFVILQHECPSPSLNVYYIMYTLVYCCLHDFYVAWLFLAWNGHAISSHPFESISIKKTY